MHLFVVDSDWREPDGVTDDSVQAAWLRNALAASGARWKIVTMHHPPYSSAHHGSTEWMRWPFEAWGAHAVITGHDHAYERVTRGPFPYFVNGLGGAQRYEIHVPIDGSQVRFNTEHGAMRVDADDTQITFGFVTASGALVDTYTLYADPAAHSPAAPSGLAAVPVSGTEVDLVWVDNASNEESVLVEVAAGAGAFTPIASVGADITRFAVSELEPVTTYRFRVTARNAAGTSSPAPVADATTTVPGPPPAPTGLRATPIGMNQIDLAWTDAASNERGLVLERSEEGGPFAVVASLPANATSYAAMGLSPIAAHGFRVRAFNASGSSPWSSVVTARTLAPDLSVTALADVPSGLRPGESAKVSSTTANGGTGSTRTSVTRYSLVNVSGNRTLLKGGSPISALGPGQQKKASTNIEVPDSASIGEYRLEACADGNLVVAESREDNNCRTWPSPLRIGWPDLRAVSVSAPPSRIRRGAKFTVTDTVVNEGVAGAPSSRTRYFLSTAGTPGPQLTGERGVGKLAPAQRSSGSVSVTVPLSTALGTYRVLACAGAKLSVREADDTNNCVASTGTVVVDP